MQNILNNISKNIKKVTYPKKQLKYDRLFKLYIIPAINLVPPQRGHDFPVTLLYTQLVILGDILFKTFAKKGKKTIYNESINIVILIHI